MKKFNTAMVLIFVICLAACSPVALDAGKAGQDKGQDILVSSGDAIADLNSNNGLVQDPAAEAPAVENHVTKGETRPVVLYFAGGDGNLVPEQRQIAKLPGIARQSMEELCLGPQVKGLTATIPAGTRLLDINIKDGLCTVNFSKEMVTNHPGGSAGESCTVYSIVNTLTQFPAIRKVIILIEGRVVETLAGHLELSAPLERNSEILGN